MFFLIQICYIIVCSTVAIVWSMDLLSIYQPIQHEARFTNFEVFVNESYGKVLDGTFKQYYDKQVMNVHMVFHKKGVMFRMNYDLTKCKEHYIDCVNVRTFDIVHLCGNEKAVKLFYKAGYQNRDILCELQGEYIIKNMTVNFDKIVPLFFAPTEKWWELSFKWKITFYNEASDVLKSYIGSNEMLTFRGRNRKTPPLLLKLK